MCYTLLMKKMDLDIFLRRLVFTLINVDTQESLSSEVTQKTHGWSVRCTLSEKQSKFPQYNTKCRGKRDTT